MKSQTFFLKTLTVAAGFLLVAPCSCFAAQAASSSGGHVTLWQLLKAGGWAMVFLGLLSVVTLTMIFYNFLTIQLKSLVPMEFTDNLVMKLETHDLQGARVLCEKKKNIMTVMALAGINRASRGKVVMREAMEKALNKEIGKLFKSISFLGDIAGIAPLLGLLGTVIGMIQAFNVIATAGNSLKPVMLVGGISKALITTAAGLVIAIPALCFYSYFKGIVQDIYDMAEDYSTDIIKLIEEASTEGLPSRLHTHSSSLPSSRREHEAQEVLFGA